MQTLEKKDNDRTISGIPLKKIYNPEDIAGMDYERDLGSPGEVPFTRGAYPNMYHDRLWRIFQLSGFGTAEDERERILYLLDQGETGFIMESDMSTWYLYDVDHPAVLSRKDEVGQFGPPMFSLEEFEIGLSLGGRLQQVRQVMDLLQQEKVENITVIVGGTIPREDIPLLKEMGISEVFPPGSSLEAIIKHIEGIFLLNP